MSGLLYITINQYTFYMITLWILIGILCLVVFKNHLGAFEAPTEDDLSEAPASVWYATQTMLCVGAVIAWPAVIYLVYKTWPDNE